MSMSLRSLCATALCALLPLMSQGVAAQAFQPGDILISNHNGNNIQRLQPASGAVNTLVNVGGTPIGLALDTTGKLYINLNNGIERYDPATGGLTHFFTGNGQREGLAFDRDSGLLFSISFGSNVCEVVDLNGRLVRTISIPGTSGLLGVAVRSGTLVITDVFGGGVYVGITTGNDFTRIGTLTGGNTYAPAIDIAGNIFVNDFSQGTVVQFTPQRSGGYAKTIFIAGLRNPDNGLSIGPDGSFTVSEYTANRVSIYNNNGTLRRQYPGVLNPDELVVYAPPCANAGGDTDGDGLCDDWEKFGLTVNVNGVPTFVDLPAMGADPNHKDIFIQADYMVDSGLCLPILGCVFGHTHKPKLDAVARVTQAFASAPVNNPDGTMGVRLHVDCGPTCVMNPLTGQTWGAMSRAKSLDHNDTLGTTTAGNYSWTAFDVIKKANFSPARNPVFHYVVFAHNLGGLGGTSGISRGITASDFIVSLGSWPGQIGTSAQQAGTLMHELGHNLSLLHGGSDSVNYKPNFVSVMNYFFQMGGVIVNGAQGTLDYSRFNLPSLNENSLNEAVGLSGGAAFAPYGTMYFCQGGGASRFVVNGNGAIDWNCNGVNNEAAIATDINRDAARTVLTGRNDWPTLVYNGGSVGELGLAAQLPNETPGQDEVTPAIDALITKPLNVAVISPGITQASPGHGLDLSFTITNGGTQNDTYLLNFTASVPWAGAGGVPGSISLNAGASGQVIVHVTVPAGALAGATGDFVLKATSVTNSGVLDTGEASVIVVSGVPRLAAKVASQSIAGTTMTLNLQITNQGPGAALNATIGNFSVRTLAGTGTVTVTAPPVPYGVGNLPVGGSVMVPLTLNVPSTVSRFSFVQNGTVRDVGGTTYSYSMSEIVNR